MNVEETKTNENNRVLWISLTVLIFLFVISICILGIFKKDDRTDRSIGGFIDIAPEYNRHEKFVIIGGRVFYPTKQAKDFTFPRVPDHDEAIEKTDDASEETITLQKVVPQKDDSIPHDPTVIYKEHYVITKYPLGDGRNKDYRDDVQWIELLTLVGDEKAAWTQQEDIDLFRNDDGEILRLSPGTDGYFRFQLNNKSESAVHAVMRIDEPEDGIHLPMIFSLEEEDTGNKSPETVLEEDGAVRLSFDIDKDDSGIYRLNWKWPYESGDDVYDGEMGNLAGQYILNTTIYAETID